MTFSDSGLLYRMKPFSRPLNRQKYDGLFDYFVTILAELIIILMGILVGILIFILFQNIKEAWMDTHGRPYIEELNQAL